MGQAREEGVGEFAAAGDERHAAAGGAVGNPQPHGVAGQGAARKAGRVAGHGESADGEAGVGAVAVAERDGHAEGEREDGHPGEGLRHRQHAAVLGEHGEGGVGGVELELAGLAQQGDAEGVVQLGVGEHDSLDGHVAHAGGRVAVEARHLLPHVG